MEWMDDRASLLIDRAIALGYAPKYDQAEKIVERVGDGWRDDAVLVTELQRIGLGKRAVTA